MRWTVRAAIYAVLLATIAGCATPGELTTQLAMSDFAYEPVPIVLPADTPGYELQLSNAGSLPHDFSVEGLPEDVRIHLVLLPGDQTPYPLPALPAGEYTVFCGVVGHREAGMETTLTVL